MSCGLHPIPVATGRGVYCDGSERERWAVRDFEAKGYDGIVTIGESENNDQWRDSMTEKRKRVQGLRLRYAAEPRYATGYEEVENGGCNSGVGRDNALIKCHESAPLCASAA